MPTPIPERDTVVDALHRAETLFLDAKRRTDEFLATLGHEMRNPLSSLSNALDLLGRERDPEEIESLRAVMLRQVEQLTRLSEDLLDAARIAQGKLELRRRQIGLRELVEGACEQVRPFIDRCGHALTVRLPHEPVVVYGDPSRLVQVFANLIQNAAKFTDRNGSLSVTIERQDTTAAVRVRDNGRGFDEEMLPALFEPFSQGRGGDALINDGVGIGLRLVKTIVELHGGAVAARSDGLGRGSEFTVRLPAVNEDSPQGPPATSASDGDRNGNSPSPAHRIVVVDDDRSSAELLARMLRSVGHSVTVAGDGATAIRTVLAERPRVVFLDIVMRGMDGCEVARRLRQHEELEGLVLIALSGNGDEDSKRRATAAGFDRYLVKPARTTVLAETLASVPIESCCPVRPASHRAPRN